MFEVHILVPKTVISIIVSARSSRKQFFGKARIPPPLSERLQVRLKAFGRFARAEGAAIALKSMGLYVYAVRQ
jgi:hypothetical protein